MQTLNIHIFVLLGLLVVIFAVVFVVGYFIGARYQIDLPFIDVLDEHGRIIFRKDADGWTGITRRGKEFSYEDDTNNEKERAHEETFIATDE